MEINSENSQLYSCLPAQVESATCICFQSKSFRSLILFKLVSEDLIVSYLKFLLLVLPDPSNFFLSVLVLVFI